MLTTKGVRDLIRQPWWPLVKNEAARCIAVRIRAEDPALKPHGSIMGQMFVELLNTRPEFRMVVHYLTSRKWEELVSDVAEDLSDAALETFRHKEGSEWWKEFQAFLITAWKQSVAPDAVKKEEPPPVEPWITLLCPRCVKPVGKIDSDDYWKVRKENPYFCVWHQACEELKDGEILDIGVTVRKEIG